MLTGLGALQREALYRRRGEKDTNQQPQVSHVEHTSVDRCVEVWKYILLSFIYAKLRRQFVYCYGINIPHACNVTPRNLTLIHVSFRVAGCNFAFMLRERKYVNICGSRRKIIKSGTF
jgi:hypothetical protein